MKQILDISVDSVVNYDAEKAKGIAGVIIKAGQGQHIDNIQKHVDGFTRVGIPIGYYWVIDARYSPESHKAAIKFRFSNKDFGQLGLWLDIEKPYLSMKDWQYFLLPYAYYKPIESVWRGIFEFSGVWAGWYTSPGAWALICGKMPLSLQQEIAAKARLWDAHYTTADHPNLFGAWTKWTMWQYQGEPDLSWISEADFAALTGAPIPPPPAPSPIQKVDVKVMSNDPNSALMDVIVDGVSVKDESTLTLFPFPVAEHPIPDGKRYAILRHKPRDVIAGRYAPDTVTLQDRPKGVGKGPGLPITPNMWHYIDSINDEKGRKYAHSIGMMWINDRTEPYEAERISCGGNFVEVLEIKNDHARINTFKYTDKMGYDTSQFNWHNHPELFFKAIAINKDGNLINVASDVDCYLPLLNRNDEVWVQLPPVYNDKGELEHAGAELFPELPMEVVVQKTLNLFDAPDGNQIDVLMFGENQTLYNYSLRGVVIWGQLDKGWIALRGQNKIPTTTWKLDTVGVIPPG